MSFLSSNDEFINKLSNIKMIKLELLVHGCFEKLYLTSNYLLYPCKNMLIEPKCQYMSIRPRNFVSNMLCSYCTKSKYSNNRRN